MHWVDVYRQELTRRHKLKNKDPQEYERIYSLNPKKLKADCKGEHSWVPATTIMIHDGARKSSEILGITRRGLHEAAPYEENDHLCVPQVCWNCCNAYRIKIIQSLTAKEQHIYEKKIKKQKKIKKSQAKSPPMMTSIDQIF